MSRWERRLVVVCVCGLLLFGCGSEEPAPALTPTPSELPSTPEVPIETPEVEPSVEVVEVVEVEAVAPEEGPVTPVISGEATLAPEMPDFDELEHVDASFEMSGGTTHYEEVAYPPAVQGALLRQLRATMRDLLDGFVTAPETGDDEDYTASYYAARCDVNLALPEIVAYTCFRSINSGRGDWEEIVVATKLFGITGENVRELEADDLLIPGVDLGELSERYEVDTNGPMTLTYSGVGFVDDQGEVAEIPYRDLGALIDPRSAAGTVPGVAAIAAVTTQLALDAAPPTSIAVLTPARPLPSAAIFAANQQANWIFADVRGASVAAATPMVVAASGSLPTGTSSVERPWSTPLRVHRGHLHRAAQLRPAPRRPAEGAMLPGGTALYAVLGETGAGASRTGGGQWTFVAVSETRMGWLPSALVRDSDGPIATPSVEAFAASLPEAERAGVRGACTAIEAGTGYVLVAERGGSTRVGLVTPSPGGVPTLRMSMAHPGTLLDARVAGATSSYDARSLVVLTWAIAGDDAHVLVEIYATPASGSDVGAPVSTLTLASSSVPARERQSVAVSVTRRGRYAPLVVRGPGRAETRYTFSGTALAAVTD